MPARAGPVDAVLITHSHVDHLNRWSLKAIDRAAHLVVPKGAKEIVTDLGFRRVTELDPGDQLEINGIEIDAVADAPRQRPLAQGRLADASATSCRRTARPIHHAGDVDFSDHAVFDDIGKQFAIDATLLPIGGMMPVWYYRGAATGSIAASTSIPTARVDIYERLGAKAMVPIHWGTLHLSAMRLRRHAEAQARAGRRRERGVDGRPDPRPRRALLPLTR